MTYSKTLNAISDAQRAGVCVFCLQPTPLSGGTHLGVGARSDTRGSLDF